MSTELIVIEKLELAKIFSEGGIDPILDQIEKEVRSFHQDLTTEEGRKAIASMAYKVARSKTALDEAGKKLVETKKKEVALVDAERKKVRDRMDALKEEVRRPLTEWEDRNKKRIDEHKAILERFSSETDRFVQQLATDWESIDFARLVALSKEIYNCDRDWEEFKYLADNTRKALWEKLTRAIEQVNKRQEEKKELERLRKEEEARKIREREEQIRQEAEQKAKKEAEEKARKEKEELELKARSEKEESERQVREERERFEREKQAEIDRERKAKEEAERRAESEKLAREKAEAERKKARAKFQQKTKAMVATAAAALREYKNSLDLMDDFDCDFAAEIVITALYSQDTNAKDENKS